MSSGKVLDDVDFLEHFWVVHAVKQKRYRRQHRADAVDVGVKFVGSVEDGAEDGTNYAALACSMGKCSGMCTVREQTLSLVPDPVRV